MALISMTGFARADGSHAGLSWHWEAKSVNGKSLDVRCRLPYGFEGLEAGIREAAARNFQRGNIQLNLQIFREVAASTVQVNEDALAHVVEIAESLRSKLDAPPPTVEGLLALRGVLETAEAPEDKSETEARDRAIMASLDTLFADLAAMRAAEGAKMETVMREQLDRIEALSTAARDCPERSVEVVRQKLADQVARLIDASSQLDPERLHQEAVLLAGKADIQEELDRLFAHIAAARDLLEQEGPVGRKIDFLSQEFNREANTLCSKSSDKALSRIGLDLKTVIDQLREQVQNIE